MMDSFDLAEAEMSLPSNADLSWIVSNGGVEPDPFERTMSPISLAGNLATIRRNRVIQQQGQAEKPSFSLPQQPAQQASHQAQRLPNGIEKSHETSENSSLDIGQRIVMTRMKSDDSFVRRQGSGEWDLLEGESIKTK